MKALKLFVSALAIFVMAQSCTKEYITNEYYQGVGIYSRDYIITPSDWTVNYEDGKDIARHDNYFWAEFDNPDITENVVKAGTVQAFIYTESEDGAIKSWNPLPFVTPIQITEYDDNNNPINSYILAESIRIEYNVGKITFILQDMDGINPADIDNDMTVKVCVTI